jgi:hypothetical protein
MRRYAHRVGAICYVLWGLLHVAGASVLLWQASRDGATTALATIGSNMPATELAPLQGGLTAAVLSYYAWNLLWIGALVAIVGGRLNWRNSRSGYWLNLVVVSAVDGGLLLLLVLPGYMALADGLAGVVLWLPAIIFSTVGLQAAPALLAPQGAVGD